MNEGCCDGFSLGCILGNIDSLGEEDGLFVGESDGVKEGDCDDSSVGALEVWTDGCMEGSILDVIVGDTETVGNDETEIDGLILGDMETVGNDEIEVDGMILGVVGYKIIPMIFDGAGLGLFDSAFGRRVTSVVGYDEDAILYDKCVQIQEEEK